MRSAQGPAEGRGKLDGMELTVELVTLALRQSRGVKAQAAAALEVTWGQLNRWMKDHRAELASVMEELDEQLADAALEVLWESLDKGGLKATMFVLERKAGWSRKTESRVEHALERPKPADYLPAVVDERELAARQSKQLPEARPAEFVEVGDEPEPVPVAARRVEAEAVAVVEAPAPAELEPEPDEPPGGRYGPCPRCAANLQAPGAWAKAEGHKGSCSKCGYPAVQQPQSLAQATLRH